jgi:epoxyqueuosine reductase QueG
MKRMKNDIRNLIIDYVRSYPKLKRTSTTWQEPLISFAAADDKLFPKLKEVVSPTHALPTDFLTDAQSVIAYFIPFVQDTVTSNIKQPHSSRDWAIAYIETNQLIHDLNIMIHDNLIENHYDASMIPATHNFDKTKLISDWSHRHVAFIAGLGTFGINNMLITEKGCCGRLGSVVTNLRLSSDPRTNKENCLFKYNGRCKKCVERCGTGALTHHSFDRFICYDMCLQNADRYSELGLADVCGKCLVNLPCSFTNPTGKLP